VPAATSKAAPNGNTTTSGYDPLGRPTAKTTTGSGGVARAAYAWTHNRAGQILTESSTITGDPTNGTRTYGYDPLARLVTVTDAATVTYGWQQVPNRSSVQTGANPAVTTTYDDANRPLADSAGGAYGSDPEGRLTARPGQTRALPVPGTSDMPTR
jgi:YD repeat-containing protein